MIEELEDAINEAIAEADDELMEKFFEGEEFTEEERFRGFEEGVAAGIIAPVYCGDSVTLRGIEMLLHEFKKIFPSAEEVASEVATDADGKEVKLFYFKSSDLTSDDVVFDTENELSHTPAQKKTAVIEMLNSGLLGNENGIIDLRTKAKILDILGYGSLDNTQDIAKLHRNKAEKENIDLKNDKIPVDFYIFVRKVTAPSCCLRIA